ncbi:MAG: DMT family transporter [Betaproteobacteria bacterium]|nr:DMT family transporter [Betaproteobacteria bacterium]
MSDTRDRPGVSAHLLLALTALFWAGHWIVARAVHLEVTPVGLAFWRWATAIAVLVPLAGRELARDWPVVRAHWGRILFFGVTGTGVYNVVGYLGIRETTATNAVLIQAVTPALIPLFGLLLFRERAGARALAGVALSFCGVLAIVSRLDPQAVRAWRVNPGDLFLLGNVALWALYTVCLRWKPPALSHMSFLLACALFGMAPMLPLYAADLAAGGRVDLSWGPMLGIAYLGVFPSVVCYQLWGQGVQAIGPRRAGAYLYLIPFFGALMAVAFLGERLHLYHAVGIALIFSGVWLAVRGRAA